MSPAEKSISRLSMIAGIPITLMFGHLVIFSGRLFPVMWEWFRFWMGSL